MTSACDDAECEGVIVVEEDDDGDPAMVVNDMSFSAAVSLSAMLHLNLGQQKGMDHDLQWQT